MPQNGPRRNGHAAPARDAGANAGSPSRRESWLAGGILAAALLFVHAGGLRFAPLLDDGWSVLDNPVFRGELPWWTLLDGRAARAEVPLAAQPLVLLSHLVGRALLGQRALGFHLVNLLLALAVAVGGYRLLRARLQSPALALLGACWFVLHPLGVEAVAGLAHRGTLLCTLLTLLALRAVARARAAHTPPRRRLWRAAAGLATLGAGLSLPSPACAPLLLLLHDLWPARATDAAGQGEPLAVRARDWLALAAGAAVALLWQRWAFAGLPIWGAGTWQQPAPTSAGEHALRWLWGLWAGALKLLVPTGLAAAYQERYFHGNFERAVAAAMVAGFALVVGLATTLRRRAPDATLAVLLGLVATLPALSRAGDQPVQADRHLYLPLLFWLPACLLAASRAGRWLVRRRPLPRGLRDRLSRALGRAPLGVPGAAVAALVLLGLCAQQARARALLWRDDVTLWDATVLAAPLSARAWAQLAHAELASGRLGMAETSGHRALELDPELVAGAWILGRITQRLGSVEQGCQMLAEAHRVAGAAARPDLLAERALCQNRLARPDLALELSEAALRRAPWLEVAQLARASARRALDSGSGQGPPTR